MNKSLLSIAIGLILSTGASSSLYADVLSNVVPDDLKEPIGLYNLSNPDVVLMTVKTVTTNGGVCQASDDYANCTLADVIADVDGTDNFKPEIKVLLTTNDLTPDTNTSNATLRLRGQASRFAPQKSFRIKLDSKTNLWRGERRIQLIKSVFDFTRIRNALSYELLTSIPALPSLRTQFVDLYVDNGTPKDYGLYTHVEHVGKEFLINRGWDKNSPVYKAEHFAFKNKDVYKLDAKGKPLDEAAFEKNLEIKRGKDHSKLAEMLAALNDDSVDFNTQIMGKYFNQENYLSWFAFNILINNTDTENKNFYLYNPKGKDSFYFMSWDNDFAWGASLEDPASTIAQWPRWWFSEANWWDIKLHQRFLSQAGNLELLKSAVTEMRNKYLTPANIKAIVDKYYPLVFPRVTTNPDLDYLYVRGDTEADKKSDYTLLVNQLKDNVEQNYRLFMQRADDPMTFYLDDEVVFEGNKATFNWDKAISLAKHGITYDLEVATTSTFEDGTVLEKITNIPDTSFTVHWERPAGTYYYRVIARDVHAPLKHFQDAKNEADDLFYPGTEVPLYGVVKFKTTTGSNGRPLPVNLSPIVADQNIATGVNNAVSISLKGSDADSTTLSYSVIESPMHGKLSGQGKTLKYTPNVDYHGTDSFRYVVGDGRAFSKVAVVSIKIEGDNNVPVAKDKAVSTFKGKAVVIHAEATDANTNDVLSYALASQPRHGTATIRGTTITYTPTANFVGTDSFLYTANDGKADSNQAVVTIIVSTDSAISNLVAANAITIDGKTEDWGSVTLFSDDVDEVAISTDSKIDWKNVGIAHTDTDVFFAYHNKKTIPNSFDWGWQTFMDTDGDKSTGYKINDTVGADYLLEGETLLRYIGNGENWVWKTVDKAFMRSSGNTAELRFPRQWIANPNAMRVLFVGNNEAYGGSDIDTYPKASGYFDYKFSLSTTGNHPPRVQSQNVSISKNTHKIITLLGYDIDSGDTLTFVAVDQSNHGTLKWNGNTVTYTPALNFVGTDSFTYRVNDGMVNSAIATVSISVTESGNAETSNPVTASTLSVDGNTQDWRTLKSFFADTDNLPSNKYGVIDWSRVSMAHSADTLYLLYQNKKAVTLPLAWGWQAYLDTDANPNTGYKLSNGLGADYILEGNALLRYTGTGDDWRWQFVDNASIATSGNNIELSFPRGLITDPALINIAFFGNNDAYAQGGAADAYPANALDNQSGLEYFSYRLGGVGATASAKAAQKAYTSPASHQPSASSISRQPQKAQMTAAASSKKGGGSISWGYLALLTSLIAIRRRYMK
ncbi:MAG: hypothetical protein DSZ29_01975 [Aquificaceae bacterium]|nr:MAG: hypothetical protein DSZ29_01975 [Aquificaceae bacterium]